ncbi:HK97-gp10 family putative phage morphogenesis protein [Caloramator sp. Dgby_cultured_2]|uniref:HK97-gp10 family putative phage morphogenesis protein n=1 Tax=Caloramator sp. Dgby_cultured_2 TaxID=3029174 RepID=UPI00237D7C1A|nr:HK97-gp10 family putative phage morphogenesis protein [Caloramator sp. Dgby_cultured_2]WDU84210.1 HK97 gp10 family phage protein [Caloramator sp. Dgby_cultured_2]
MGVEVKFEGIDELLKQLQQLGEKAGRVENQALREGAEIIQKAASEKAPRSDRNKEHLADNIKISKVKTKNGVKYIEVGPQRGDNDKFFMASLLNLGHLNNLQDLSCIQQ